MKYYLSKTEAWTVFVGSVLMSTIFEMIGSVPGSIRFGSLVILAMGIAMYPYRRNKDE